MRVVSIVPFARSFVQSVSLVHSLSLAFGPCRYGDNDFRRSGATLPAVFVHSARFVCTRARQIRSEAPFQETRQVPAEFAFRGTKRNDRLNRWVVGRPTSAMTINLKIWGYSSGANFGIGSPPGHDRSVKRARLRPCSRRTDVFRARTDFTRRRKRFRNKRARPKRSERPNRREPRQFIAIIRLRKYFLIGFCLLRLTIQVKSISPLKRATSQPKPMQDMFPR